MSNPLPQVDIESEMATQMNRLEGVTHKLADRSRKAAIAEHAYKVAYAKSLLLAKANDGGSVAMCEAQATVENDELLLARLTTEADRSASQEAGRNTRARLDALRSLNTNHRALVIGD